MNPEFPVQGFAEQMGFALLSIGMLLTTVRLVRGPSLPDRVVALDLLTILGLGMLALYATATENAAYLDVGIVLTLVTFLATISFAYYIEKGTSRDEREGTEQRRNGGTRVYRHRHIHNRKEER